MQYGFAQVFSQISAPRAKLTCMFNVRGNPIVKIIKTGRIEKVEWRFAKIFPLTRIKKKVYSLIRKSVSSLRELLPMTTALFSTPAKKQIPSPKTVEKLDLELDFVKASLPTKTCMTHPHMLFTPMHYEPNYAYPLLIWLHDTGGSERQLMQIMPTISMRNYVAVAPRGLPVEQSMGSPTFDLSVSAILHRRKEQYDWILSDNNLATLEQRIFDCVVLAQERCHIAEHRIFIAGFGTGGTAALRLATQYPERFAGVATFGGEMPHNNRILPSWHTRQPLSFFLGVDESASDHVYRMMELLHLSGLTPSVREYPDIQSLSPAMMQDMNQWMMQIVCQPAKATMVSAV